MRQFYFNGFLCAFLLMVVSSISAQTSNQIWHKKNAFEFNSISKIERRTTPKEFEVYNLDVASLKFHLQSSPDRKAKLLKSTTILSFPNAVGELEKYEVFEASILNKKLQEKFPSIKSYVGKSIDNPGKVIRFSLSEIGLHAMIMGSGEGAVYIDPYTSNKESYIIYKKKDLPSIDSFECLVEDTAAASKQTFGALGSKSQNADDSKLRTFRLAIATTGEYSQFQLVYHGVSSSSTVQYKKEVIISAINATMTRVNGIFERDVALTMELVGNNDEVIFLDPISDGFTNDDGGVLINESQEKIDAIIGTANYDIGHTFSTGGGGLARLKSPCVPGAKASGITGSSYPVGDNYDVDFVAHEMGHQYGANHTFNSIEGGCAGNRNDETAIEPGSGSTIMGYAGLCAPDNIQSHGDDYFHLVSIQEMWGNITLGNSTCANQKEIANTPPVIDELISYTLPISTPFALEAIAADDASDVLTYTWEQLDPEEAVAPPVATLTEGPSFRSLGPNVSPIRYFPNQETVIAGDLFNDWEALPSVSRTMNFGVNVRDNNINGGQTASKETTLTFDNSAGPFKLTSQVNPESWNAGSKQTILWDVANTNVTPVNCTSVNVLFSTDGGYTFPISLASNVTNNGSLEIDAPNVTTTKGRIKIESTNNIFYAINGADITVQAKEFTITLNEEVVEVCKDNDAKYSFTYNTALEFNEVTTFSVVGNPTGTTVSFNPTTATANATAVEMTISGMNAADIGSYDLTISGTSDVTSMVKNEPVVLKVFDGVLVVPNLIVPVDAMADFVSPYQLEWDMDENSTSYSVQIAIDDSFNTIIEENDVSENTYIPENLGVNTKYYWRVKAKNSCDESAFSSVFSFITANEVCNLYTATGTPIAIPDDDPNGVNSIINVGDPQTVTNVVVKVSIIHSYVSDLALTLISPNGISIILSVGNGGDGNNYTNTIFDDDAVSAIADGSAPFSGKFTPQIPLSFLDGIEASGNWILKVVDSGEADTGSITNWSLDICGIPIIIENDDDNDGVKNDIDQCPDTTAGATVDAVGCFTLAPDNFNVEAKSATCADKNNGQIIISAKDVSYNYTTTINGETYSFSNSRIISDLPPGTYDFCVSVTGEGYEQCFVLEVDKGISIEGKASITSKKATIEILKGTAPFDVLVNGKLMFKTAQSIFMVDVNHNDLIEVKTDVICEGVFAERVDLLREIVAYPNPTTNSFYLDLPLAQKEVVIELYNMQSQLISSNKYNVINGRVQVDIENNAVGIYMAKVLLDKPIVLKVIKK